MINLKKNLITFIILLAQTLLAISGGFVALYITIGQRISPATFVESVDIGNLEKDQAVEKMKSFYEDWTKKQKVTIQVDGENRQLEVGFEEIAGHVDYEGTLEQIVGEGKPRSFTNVINGYFMVKRSVFSPVIRFDESKMKARLQELGSYLYKEPVNAKIYLKDGKVVKVPGANGKRLNIDHALNKLNTELQAGYKPTILFSFSNNYELEVIRPTARTEDLVGVDEIVATYSTEIKSAELLDSIKKAVSAINRVLIYAVDPNTGERAGVFSFNKYLNAENLLKDENDEGFNQVASTLHGAVIFAGIDPKGITRFQHKSQVEYIEPGLDVRVFGNVEDYKFRNSLDNNIVIFAEIKDNKVVVSLVGKKKNDAVVQDIKVEVVEKSKPGVVEVESQDLKPGMSNIINPGMEGVKVNVYRIIEKSGSGTEKQILYTNDYDPRDTILQVSPATGKFNRSTK
ncbi:MAG: VanW family protein [Clostridia bacterium]|nr:VanW family protein [Clostridia bacterium]